VAKMQWFRLEWQRRARTHEPLADPYISVPTERQRQLQQSRRKGKRKKGGVAVPSSDARERKRRAAAKANKLQARAAFHAATLRAVQRVVREQKTSDPALIARHLGIPEDRATEYLAELGRRAGMN
jgi:hypothetical protein